MIALGGGILLFGAPAISGGSEKELIGNGLLLVAAVSYAALVLHSKKIVTDRNLFAVFGSKFFAVAHLHLLASLIFEDVGSITSASSSAISALIIASTLTGFVGIYIFYKALEYVRGEDAAPLFYLDPLWGSLGGIIILGEVLSDAAVVASGIIIAGIIISHPVHLNRYLYYQKYSHSKFEEFVRWLKKEYDSVTRMIHKYF